MPFEVETLPRKLSGCCLDEVWMPYGQEAIGWRREFNRKFVMSTQRIAIRGGMHSRRHTPMECPVTPKCSPGSVLLREDTGKVLPCQIVDDRLHWIIDDLPAGATCNLVLRTQDDLDESTGVKLTDSQRPGELAIEISGQPFATYHYADVPFRPYFHPVCGPGGVQITRNYPMVSGVKGETEDHHHHRSVWVAFGEVNGSDNWSEEQGHSGFQVHRKTTKMLDGPVLGLFEHEIDWLTAKRDRVLTETRTICAYNTPDDVRSLDMTVRFTADHGRVVFGDTKEGGICSVRVATSMDGNKAGRIENSAGGIGEAETWGKPAHWCDYSGPCGGQQVGIAIFDHPMNLRHPTPWHVRNYGLMSANPFGHAAYKSSLLKDGTYVLEAGESLTFNYRIFIHAGDATAANVRDRYHDYLHPPAVEM